MAGHTAISKHNNELQDTFVDVTSKFKLCPNRLWAVTGERLHDLLPQGPLPSHKDHDQCTFDFCEFSQRDYTSVEQRHECDDKDNCRSRLFPKRLLDEAINKGRPTVWRLDGESLIEWPQPYMAISHVWADGTGAGIWPDGEVNECLYAYFERIARQFQCEGIWWDTICIPRGKNERNKAINNMHHNYQDARITLVHDSFIRSWDWINAETACFVIIISPWFSRGWTALELAMSRKVKVIFNGPKNQPVTKDLDEQILAKERVGCEYGHPETRHEMLSKIIRNLRTGVASLNDLLSILGSRYTSWPRDMLTIAKLLLNIETGPDVQPQEVQIAILKRLGKISPASLFHNSATTLKGTSWCPTRLFDMPQSDLPPSLRVHKNLELEGEWQPLILNKVLERSSFFWHLTHPLIRRVLEKGLEDEACVLMAEHYEDQCSEMGPQIVSRALLVRKTSFSHKFQFLGAVYFHPPLAKERITDVGPQNIVILSGKMDRTECVAPFQTRNYKQEYLSLTDGSGGNADDDPYTNKQGVRQQLPSVGKPNPSISDTLLGQNTLVVMYPSSHRWTPLHYYIWRGQTQMVRDLIISLPIEIGQTDRYGRSALHLAAERGHLESVQLLHSALDLSRDPKSTVLESAIWGGSTAVVEFLIDNNYKPLDGGLIGIQTASTLGYASLLRMLHKKVSDLSDVVMQSADPLHSAVINGHKEAVQVWIESIPDLGQKRDKFGRTALHTASISGHISIVKIIIEHHDVNTVDMFGQTPLHLALIYNHTEIAMLLIDNDADIDIVSKSIDWTPLHFAAKHCEMELAQLLIRRRSSMVHARDRYVHWTPLHFAAMNGHLQMARLLIHHGANFEKDNLGWTPGMFAMFKGHLDLVEICGGDAQNHPEDVWNFQRWTNLHFAAINGDSFVSLLRSQTESKRQTNIQVVYKATVGDDLLTGFNAPTNPGDYQAPETALSYAVTNSQIPVIKLLLKWGAKIHTKTPDGATCLHYAARDGSLGLARFLVAQGAKIDEEDPNRETALHWAAKYGNRAVAGFLIEKGGNVHLRTSEDNFTPLHLAAGGGYPEVADILINSGANMREATHLNGDTPLSLAVQYNRVEVVQFLMQRGLNARVTKYKGASMLHLAAFEGKADVARLLIHDGAVVDEADMSGSTPLHFASWRGKDGIVELLTENGANLEAKDDRGYTPLHVAREHLQISTADLLLEKGAKDGSPHRTRRPIRDSLILDITEDSQLQATSLLNPNPSLKISSLHIAARRGDVELVKVLIKGGAKVHAKDYQKLTPLHLAARFGHLHTAQALLDNHSKSIRAEDCNGMTPLVYAASSGCAQLVADLLRSMGKRPGARCLSYALRSAIIANHCDVAKILLSKKADLRLVDEDDVETWRHAVELGHISALQLLIEHGFSVNETGKNGCTALHFAAALGDISTSRFLIKNKAYVNADDAQSTMPIYHAARYGHRAMVEFLRENKAVYSGFLQADTELDRRWAAFVGEVKPEVLNRYGYRMDI